MILDIRGAPGILIATLGGASVRKRTQCTFRRNPRVRALSVACQAKRNIVALLKLPVGMIIGVKPFRKAAELAFL